MIDTHTHTQFSSDAETPMAVMAEAALRAGLSGIAFTDHIEWMAGDSATGYLIPAAYFAALRETRERYRGRLRVLAGAEVGSSHRFPQEARAMLSAWPWDFVLGSLHWVDNIRTWEPEAFREGLAAAYRQYFTELVELAAHGEFDVLAHFDLVRRNSWYLQRRILPPDHYADLIRAALKHVVERGKGLEINTSGWAAGLDEPLPGLTILRWYRELGGEILVIGSDAHTPDRVGQHFDRARALAQDAGFTHLARFERRQVVAWIPLS